MIIIDEDGIMHDVVPTKVLEQIRAEIADLKWDDYLSIGGFKKDVLQIIDKYKGE